MVQEIKPHIAKLFQVHKLNANGLEKAGDIAEAFTFLAQGLEELCPDSRELSLAKTKLEEACFFAKKAIANEKKNQETEVNA